MQRIGGHYLSLQKQYLHNVKHSDGDTFSLRPIVAAGRIMA